VIIVIVLSNIFEFLLFYALWQKINQTKQYFERALSKSLTKFGHTTLKEQQMSCIRKLVVDSQDVFAVLPTGFGKRFIYQVLPELFS
jgi:superfamily II DNA helicase RecQ